MRKSLTTGILRALLIGIFLSLTGAGATHRETQDRSPNELPEVSFNLTRALDNSRQYNLVLSDDDEHTISGSFSVEQLQILRAIMAEAEKFALSGEAVGTKDSVTTRFADKQEQAFLVDVEKLGNQSRLFLTIKTELGRTTLQAGRVLRSTRRQEGFFFDLLSRLESILPKLPSPLRK